MKLIDYYKLHMADKENSGLKEQFLKKCYEVFLEAAGSENRLKFLGMKEEISSSVIRKYAKDYMMEYTYMTCENYLENIVFEYLKNKKYEFLIEECRDSDITKLYNNKLGKETLNKLNDENKKCFLVTISRINKMIEMMRNGIMDDNNNIRNFDIIDYYQVIKIDPIYIDRIYKMFNFTREEITFYKNFFGKNDFKPNNLEMQNIYNGILIINNQPVDETLKNNLIEYLTTIGVPLNYKNFHIALRRYNNGTLIIKNKSVVNIKTKKIVNN